MTLPNVVVGAMKCGTTALHRCLDRHPEIMMSHPKELNFFFGPTGSQRRGETDRLTDDDAGNWHQGIAWYARHFAAETPVRGESSPGYTSPSFPGVASRMSAVLPGARLVYLVRDPVSRAVSQYRHHVTDGTERRPVDVALLDPRSQYVARSRFHERIAPFLRHFDPSQIAIVAQEELLVAARETLRAVFEFVGADPGFWTDGLVRRWNAGRGQCPRLDRTLQDRLADRLRGDAQRLRSLAGRDFPGWRV